MTIKEYNKTWFYKLTLPSTVSPNNWIMRKPKRLFGKTVFVVWKIAKANYPWNKDGTSVVEITGLK